MVGVDTDFLTNLVMCSLENDASILEYVKQTIKYTNTYMHVCI